MSRYLHRVFAFATWLTFPVMLSFLFPGATRLALIVAWIALAFWSLLTSRSFFRSRPGLAAGAIVATYSAYMVALVIATVIHPFPVTFRGLLVAFMKLAYGGFLLAVLTRRTLKDLWAFYTALITYLTFAAILLTVLLALGYPPPLLLNYEQSVAGGSTRAIAVYPFGFALATVPGVAIPLFRLQSFSDEPGSFAMALLPAIYWSAIVQRKRARTALLLIGLALTFSVGGVLCLLVVAVLRLTRAFRLSAKRAVWLATGGIVISLMIGFLAGSPPAWMATYLGEKFNPTEASSGGARLHQLQIAASLLRQFPEGVGPGAAMSEANSPIAIGAMKAVAEAGLLGGIAYLAALALLATVAIRSLRISTNPVVIALGASVISNLVMSLQRMQADQSFWHFFVLVTFLFAYYSHGAEAGEPSGAEAPIASPSTRVLRASAGAGALERA